MWACEAFGSNQVMRQTKESAKTSSAGLLVWCLVACWCR